MPDVLEVHEFPSDDEYTSPISKIYKIEGEYIIVTENSLYIVSADISTRKIT